MAKRQTRPKAPTDSTVEIVHEDPHFVVTHRKRVPKQIISAHVPKYLVKRLEDRAAELEVTRSYLVATVIRDYAEKL